MEKCGDCMETVERDTILWRFYVEFNLEIVLGFHGKSNYQAVSILKFQGCLYYKIFEGKFCNFEANL